ncbi:MAG: protease pro-enzyme activation domain-containing protein [Ignavibacteriota bacterium]
MSRTPYYNFISLLAISAGFAGIAAAAVPDRVTRPVDTTQITTLRSSVEPRAKPQFDRGAVESAMAMKYMVLVTQPSAVQQSDLDQLLAAQQNPSSPLYRHWLTPQEFGDRFGLSPADRSQVTAWLTSAGFTIDRHAGGRNWIAFSGTAGQVTRALHTPIHRFQVDGETHYANTADPSVPAALAGVVGGFLGLNDFHARSMISSVSPAYTSGSSHYMAPQDWATIYNVSPLYQAGFDGTGQKIAVVGESDVAIADIRSFRTFFGLAANDPKMVLYGGADPGYTAAQIEGNLDLEWAGAIAPKASIYYVYGANVFTAMVYAIDQNVAPVITVSYGGCEVGYRLNYWRAIAQQANAQGITILNSSGDSGAGGCDPQGVLPYAANGISTDFPAALPEVTAVGGTQFVEGSSSYWGTKNGTTYGSVLSYIPEVAWNESGPYGLASGGGGASALYSKPIWQAGTGVPADNARDVPDISFSAATHDGYLIAYNGSLGAVGGTSCSSPAFAATVAILNQYQVSKGYQAVAGLGNINPQLYRLAQSASSPFHDITAGDNVVTCEQGSPGCLTGSFGFKAGTGYDLATGLGSADINSLVTQWNTQASPVNVTLFVNATRASLNDTVGMTAMVRPVAAQTLPTGTVNFSVNGVALGSSPLHTVGGLQEADLFFPAYLIGDTGATPLQAQYSGDTVFSTGTATQILQVTTPANAAGIVPTAPDTVWPSAPDAQGLSWQSLVTLQNFTSVPALVTGFTIDGAAQSVAQYFPAPAIPGFGAITTTVAQRNLVTPSTHTFGITGTDVNGNTWSRQIKVNYLPMPPGSVPVVSAAPLVVAQNPNADPSCQWQIQLHVDEAGGNAGLQETGFAVGGLDWTSSIPSLFGTDRLAPWGGLQSTICLGGITPPATETIQVVTSGYNQQIDVSLLGPVQNPTQVSVAPASVTLNATPTGASGTALLGVNVADPKATWTASVFPANRTTSWLGASQFSGTGSAQVTLTASGAGFEPGAYRALLIIECPTAVPQTVTVPILFVNSPPASGMAITSVVNSATYAASVSPGTLVAVFGSNLSNATDIATGNPLPFAVDGVTAAVNGIPAPIVYVSPTQVNVQIPYEVGAGPAVLGINNNGLVAGFPIAVAAAAPGIFADASGNLSPTATVAKGGTLTLYMTGAGELSAGFPAGLAPTALEASEVQPLLPIAVTVGGAQAFLQTVIPTPNQVGTVQIVFTLPQSVEAGVQPVVVTVGGLSSPPVNITVQ